MGKLFGTDGVRGIAGEELTAELAYQFGLASAEILAGDIKNKTKIIIGKDTRISGDMFECAIASGLTAAGGDVYIAGVVPTPAVPFLVKKYGADMGVMISASHNPSEYNGIKFFNRDGYKLSDEIEGKIEEIILNNISLPLAQGNGIGRVHMASEMREAYIDMISGVLKKEYSKETKKRKIAFDLSNGSAASTAREIFTKENAYSFDTHFISYEPDGLNINRDCGSTHLDALSKYVTQNKCDIGIAFDGDADRCLAIDENGTLIDGDKIIALIANMMKSQNRLKKNTVVVTCMTNMGFFKMAEKNDINVKATAVGDRYVLEEMLKEGYNIGGEQSGHIIVADYATTGDGQLTASLILGILAANPDKKASELFSCMEKLPQVLINMNIPNSIKKSVLSDPDVLNAVADIENKLNGNGRVLLRPSGTEALVRIMLEGENENLLTGYAAEIKKVIESKI